MVIMIYFHWIIQSPMHPDRQIPVFVKALSLDNMILFMLATPVQVIVTIACSFPFRYSVVGHFTCKVGRQSNTGLQTWTF